MHLSTYSAFLALGHLCKYLSFGVLVCAERDVFFGLVCHHFSLKCLLNESKYDILSNNVNVCLNIASLCSFTKFNYKY